MPRDVLYLEELFAGLARVRAEFTVDGRWVTTFLVQLEVVHLGKWKPARRYDDAHGRPHMDILDTSGREREKVWLDCTSNEAVTMARKDFDENWRQYVAEFLER